MQVFPRLITGFHDSVFFYNFMKKNILLDWKFEQKLEAIKTDMSTILIVFKRIQA